EWIVCGSGRCRGAMAAAGVWRGSCATANFALRGPELMRPLTVSRLLLQCLILAIILFCVMVLALKFGAIHVSLYGLGRDLLRVFLGKSSEISTEYSLILNLRLPRILLGAFVGAALS